MNPVTLARQATNPETTITDYARKVRRSAPFITRLEQGLYDKIPHSILPFIAEDIGVTTERVQVMYHNFQRDRRRDSGNLLKSSTSITYPVQPFPCSDTWKLRETRINFSAWFDNFFTTRGITRHNFCTLLCVHPATLDRYLLGEVKSMPSQLRDALSDAGLITEINDNYAKAS